MFSRHWIWCFKKGAGISACVSFRSLPKMLPTEMAFEFTHGDRIGAAVPRLKQSATLAIFWQNANNALYSALVLLLKLPNFSNILNELKCTRLFELLSGSFSIWMLSRHWVCCSEWGAGISAWLSFGSRPKIFPTEMVLESRARDSIGVAVQSLNHSAILQPSFDKSQTMLSVLHLTFFALHY